MKILFIDDQPIVCRGAAGILCESLPDCSCIMAASAGDAELQVSAAPPSLVLLDPDFADGAGNEVLRGLVTRHPLLPVLAFSYLPEIPHAASALRIGAKGFISKGATVVEFMDAVQAVLEGRRYVSPTLVSVMAARLAAPGPASALGRLSPRERELMRRLAKGLRLTDIARDMGISVKTAGTYRARALAKLGLSSNAELGANAKSLGLLDPVL